MEIYGESLHGAPLSPELEQWRLINFKRISDRIRAWKWEKNIKRTPLTCVDTPVQWRVCILLSYSPGRLPQDWERLEQDGTRGWKGTELLTFSFWATIWKNKKRLARGVSLVEFAIWHLFLTLRDRYYKRWVGKTRVRRMWTWILINTRYECTRLEVFGGLVNVFYR